MTHWHYSHFLKDFSLITQYMEEGGFDLNPLDVYVREHLKCMAYSTAVTDINNLRQRVKHGFQQI